MNLGHRQTQCEVSMKATTICPRKKSKIPNDFCSFLTSICPANVLELRNESITSDGENEINILGGRMKRDHEKIILESVGGLLYDVHR